LLEGADECDVCFLVVGDVFGATTHSDLVIRCIEKKIPYQVIHNASIMTAVGACGLQVGSDPVVTWGYFLHHFFTPKFLLFYTKIFGFFCTKIFVFFIPIFVFLHQNFCFFTPKFLFFYTNFFLYAKNVGFLHHFFTPNFEI